MSQQAPVSSDHAAATPAALLHLMRELVRLAGQEREDGRAVLELQFDDILTATSLSVEAPAPFLLVSLYLPRRDWPAALRPALSAPAYGGGELLWDASEGRYIILEQIAAASLGDERAVFDAILDAKDRASAWLAQIDESAARGRESAA